jgi:outer membrane protein assembly factor BamA
MTSLVSDGRSPGARLRVLVSILLLTFGTVACAGGQNQRNDEPATGTETTQTGDDPASRTIPGETSLRVSTFVLEGVEAFAPREIKNGLATRVDPGWRASTFISWMPLLGANHSYFNTLKWRRDLERIRTFYKSRGYFNVEIVRETVVREPEEGKVHLRIAIDEGQPVKISEVLVEGLETVERYDEQKILKGLPLKRGKIFTEEDYTQTKSQLLDRLERQGYAYADVGGRAFVFPKKGEAHIRFIADPGPQAVFGEVEIEGLESVPERYVRQALEFEPGDPYSSQALQETQEAIYNLQVFSLVSVLPAHQVGEKDGAAEDITAEEPTTVPDDAPPTPDIQTGGAPGSLGVSDLLDQAQSEAEQRSKLDERVPVVVRLREARNWNVRVGAGFAAESNRQDVHGQLDISSKNVFGGLQKLDFTNKFGYAWAPGFILTREDEAARQGIILDSRVQFIQPWFGRQTTNLRLTPSLQRDLRLGYTFWNPAARIGIDHTLFDRLTLGLGYRISYYNFQNVDRDLTAESEQLDEQTPLGRDFQPEFILEYLEQTIRLDYRDSPLNPMRGFLSELIVQEAGDYIFNGEFTYLKVALSTTGYIPVSTFTDVVLALRGRAATLYNLESVPSGRASDTQRVPTINRLYSGGRGSMRSIGRERLSIYRGSVPVGGSTQFEMAFEPRFQLVPNLAGVGDLWAAPFFDAATVLEGPFGTSTEASRALGFNTESPQSVTDSLLYGVGAGLWWVTPIGPVRFDFAYTLNDLGQDPRFPGDPSQINFLLGIGHSL